MPHNNFKLLFVDEEVELCALMRACFSTRYDVETVSNGDDHLKKEVMPRIPFKSPS